MTISTAGNPQGLLNIPQQRRAHEFVERVLMGAEALLKQAGFEAFTMNTLAEAAGVSVGGIYRYFPDRLSLLIAVQDRFLSRMDAEIADAACPRGNLKSTLDAFMDCVAGIFLDNAPLLSAFLTRKEEAAIAARGTASLRNMEDAFAATCLHFQNEIAHKDTVAAANFIHALAGGMMIMLADDVAGGATRSKWLSRVEEFKRLSLSYLKTGT